MAGDDDTQFNGGTVRWDWISGQNRPHGYEAWRDGDTQRPANDAYWNSILDQARKRYGDQGIHFASGNQLPGGKPVPDGTRGDPTRYLVYGNGEPLPASGQVTWTPDGGKTRYTSDADGYHVWGSDKAIKPDYYVRAADGKIVAMKDEKPIYAHSGDKDLGPGWKWDPALSRFIPTNNPGAGGAGAGSDESGTGQGGTAAGREGSEDSQRGGQEFHSLTDDKINKLVGQVKAQNEQAKAEIEKLRADIKRKWEELGEQVETAAGKQVFIDYVDERIKAVRKLLADAHLLNESAASEVEQSGSGYDTSGGGDGSGGGGDGGSGDTGAVDDGGGGGDTGAVDDGSGDTGAVDDGSGDTGAVDDGSTDTSGTQQPISTQQPVYAQPTQQQQQPMSSMPTMPTMPTTPSLPDISGLVPTLKSLTDDGTGSTEDPSTSAVDEGSGSGSSDEGGSGKDGPTTSDDVVEEGSTDGGSGSGEDDKSTDDKSGDDKAGDDKPATDDKATPEAGAGAKPAASTTVTLPGDGGTVEAPNAALAAAGRGVLSGQPISDAFKAQGIILPPAGTPVTEPVSTSALQFGDVGQFKDHQIMSLGGDKVVVNGQVQPLSALSTGSSFLGFFRPGDTAPGDGSTVPVAPSAAPAATAAPGAADAGTAGVAAQSGTVAPATGTTPVPATTGAGAAGS